MPRWPRDFALLATALSCSGCCTLARVFCGPDRSGWIQQSFDSPERTVTTLQEALRRDDAHVVYRCLSERLKAAEQIRGVLEARLLMDKLKEHVPLHMVGYADRSEPELLADGRVRFTLEIEGRSLGVSVVRQAYWEVFYTDEGRTEDLREGGAYFPDERELRRHLIPRLDEDDFTTVYDGRWPLIDGLIPPERIVRVGFGHEWKVDLLGLVEASPGT